MSETQEQQATQTAPPAADNRQTLLQAALVGLQSSLTVFQHYGIIGSDLTTIVPGITAPVAKLPTTPGARGAGGRFLPKNPAAPAAAAKPPRSLADLKPSKPPKAYKPPAAPADVKTFVERFCKVDERDIYAVKRGKWEWVPGKNADKPEDRRAHMLTFHGQGAVTSGAVEEDEALGKHIVCIRPIGSVVPIFNASRIRYGASWAAQQQPQALAERFGAVPVPFEPVLDKTNGAGLDPAQMEVLEWTGAETMLIPSVNHNPNSSDFDLCNRHFAGAVCLRVQDSYFLFDTDRLELQFCNFNPFFSQLPGAAKTVAEAYDLLMPAPVKEALTAGTDVIRQGEFFFVRVPDSEVVGDIVTDDFNKRIVETLISRADALAAATINGLNQDRLFKLAEFVDKYPTEKPAGGTAALQWVPDMKNAVAGLAAHLSTQVGPKEGWWYRKKLTKAEKEAARNSYRHETYTHGVNHQNTHLDHYYKELEVRLHPDFGGERGYGLRFLRRVVGTQTTAPDGSRGNGHQITLSRTVKDATYARGAVLHSGREHRPIYLSGWYRVYPNTATHNWTVDGRVD